VSATDGRLDDVGPHAGITGRFVRRWPDGWGRLVRLTRFGTVGVSGFVVNEAALAAFVSGLGLNYLLGAVLATQVSSLWNFLLVEHWAFRHADARRPFHHRLGLFFAVNNVALLLRGPILVVLTSGLGLNYLVSNLISLGVLTVARFAIADSWIWADRA
jgi:dolichol-phosphate mannosyltransferase